MFSCLFLLIFFVLYLLVIIVAESDDDATKKFVERLKVQQSIRRVHKKEKEKKENAEKSKYEIDSLFSVEFAEQ